MTMKLLYFCCQYVIFVYCFVFSICYVLRYLQIPGLCSGIGVSVVTVHDALVDCHMFVGYLAVYRVCFSMAAFFFLFMVLMIGVRSSRDPRSAIQNG